MSTFLRSIFPLALLVIGTATRAELLVANSNGDSSTPSDAILRFDDAAIGNVAPLNSIGGLQSGISSPADLWFDAVHQQLVVVDFRSQRIARYPITARGDTAPVSTFTSAAMGQPRNIAAIPGANEFAVVGSSFLSYYPMNASGQVAPTRVSQLNTGGIGNPNGVAYLPATDQVAVGDNYVDGNATLGEILIFDRLASGAMTPVRRIAGPNTRLGAMMDLRHDAEHGELIVLVADPAVGGSNPGRILVFADSAQGDVAPLREIAGIDTGIRNAVYMQYDAGQQQYLVSRGYAGVTPALLVFNRLDQGNNGPVQVISGANTRLSTQFGIGPALRVVSQVLMADGFE